MTSKAEAQARAALAHRLRDWGVDESDNKAGEFIATLVQVGWEPPTVLARSTAPDYPTNVDRLRALIRPDAPTPTDTPDDTQEQTA